MITQFSIGKIVMRSLKQKNCIIFSENFMLLSLDQYSYNAFIFLYFIFILQLIVIYNCNTDNDTISDLIEESSTKK